MKKEIEIVLPVLSKQTSAFQIHLDQILCQSRMRDSLSLAMVP